MEHNRGVLMWVLFGTIGVLLSLILMIIMGQIHFGGSLVSKIIKLATIISPLMTVIGAYLGAKISGDNATKLWKKQDEAKNAIQKRAFDSVMYHKIYKLMWKYNSTVFDCVTYIEESPIKKRYSESELQEIKEIFSKHEAVIFNIYKEFELIEESMFHLVELDKYDEEKLDKISLVGLKLGKVQFIKNPFFGANHDEWTMDLSLTYKKLSVLEALSDMYHLIVQFESEKGIE